MVLETLVFSPFNHLTRLVARKKFIKFSRRESSRSYRILIVVSSDDIFENIQLLFMSCSCDAGNNNMATKRIRPVHSVKIVSIGVEHPTFRI
jgi:hypothetical protein